MGFSFGDLIWNCTQAWQLVTSPFLFEVSKFKMSLLTFFELPLYYGKVTTSWFLELGFWLNTFLTAISECPETETVANTLWLVTNSKSCPNCKWVVCLYIIIIIIVFSLPECQWISSHVVWHKNIVTTTNFKLCCVTHTVTACKLKTLLCDTKLKNIQTANGFKPFYET